MNIFVTGATGVLGKATLPLLKASGHQIYALSRSDSNTEVMRQQGVEPVMVDLFDAAALARVLKEQKIEAIIHLATKIPPTLRMGKVAAWEENTRIRREGTRALVDAALAAGVETILYPSFYFVYPDRGDQWIDADSTPVQSHVIQQATIDAEAEVARFSKEQRRGLVLRLGNLYGPEAPSALEYYHMAQKGFAALLGPQNAYLSYIWVADAASAIQIALEKAPAGVYDVVDDEPCTRAEFAHALAQSVGKRSLFHVPAGVMRLLSGAAAEMASRSQRVSNRRFRAVTGWQPGVPNVRDGWQRIAQGCLVAR